MPILPILYIYENLDCPTAECVNMFYDLKKELIPQWSDGQEPVWM